MITAGPSAEPGGPAGAWRDSRCGCCAGHEVAGTVRCRCFAGGSAAACRSARRRSSESPAGWVDVGGGGTEDGGAPLPESRRSRMSPLGFRESWLVEVISGFSRIPPESHNPRGPQTGAPRGTLSMSERLACKAVGLARSTYRRLPAAQTRADPDAQLRSWRRLRPQTPLPWVPACLGRVALRRAP